VNSIVLSELELNVVLLSQKDRLAFFNVVKLAVGEAAP
jgi:hypothetical protein